MSDVAVKLDEAGHTLSREAGVAVWRQIAGVLEGEIASGALAPGLKLPPEARLSVRFGVNRHTVRRALDELSRNGLIAIEQGRGSFVRDDVIDYAVGVRPRFSEWIRAHNKEPSGRTIALDERPASEPAVSALGIAEGEAVVVLERLGFADNRPVSFGTHHFPRRLSGMIEALRLRATVTEALRDVGVADYVRRTTRVGARLPTTGEADLLRMPRTRPVLVTENVNVGPDGAVVEFGITLYPTPRVQLVFEP